MTHTFDSKVSLHSWLLWPTVWYPKISKMNRRRQKQNYTYNILVVASRIFEASYRTTTVGIAPYCLNAATAHWIKTTLFCYKMSKIAPFQDWQRF